MRFTVVGWFTRVGPRRIGHVVSVVSTESAIGVSERRGVVKIHGEVGL
jgi:hypothetical protein